MNSQYLLFTSYFFISPWYELVNSKKTKGNDLAYRHIPQSHILQFWLCYSIFKEHWVSGVRFLALALPYCVTLTFWYIMYDSAFIYEIKIIMFGLN